MPLRKWALSAVLGLAAAGCAEGGGGASTCGSEALPKSFFVGSDLTDPSDDPIFWYRALLLDAHGAGLVPGTGDPLSRVQFVITEDHLVAREPDGKLLAAYDIVAHEEECGAGPGGPWYKRPHMVVDWSSNLVDGYQLDIARRTGHPLASVYTPAALHVSDAENDSAPHFDLEAGAFDVTGRAFVEWTDDSGDAPACLLAHPGLSFPETCDADEITVRHSFARAQARDVEPLAWSGAMARAFGAQRVARTLESSAGAVTQELLARHNLWERTHTELACSTADDAACQAAGPGSRCDAFVHRCTLPLAERTLRPLVWYLSADPDLEVDDVFAATEDAVRAWDLALRSATAVARYTECRALGQSSCEQPVLPSPGSDFDDALTLAREIASCLRGLDAATCAERAAHVAEERGYATEALALAQADAAMVLCHVPVRAGDPAACGSTGFEPRIGDPRHNAIHLRSGAGPWIVAAPAVERETGARLSDTLTISWGAVARWAADATLSTRLALGDLDGAAELERAADAARLALARGSLSPLSSSEASSRLADLGGAATGDIPASMAAELALLLGDTGAQVAESGVAPGEEADDRVKRARDTAVEDALLTDPMRALGGDDPARWWSPLRFNHPAAVRARRHAHAQAVAHTCMLDEPPAPFTMVAAATQLEEKFGPLDEPARAEQLGRHLQRRALAWAVMHGLGHALGLAHNFAASADAVNYRTPYWQLRTENGVVRTPCSELDPSGRSCVGARYFDPPSQEERAGLAGMFMQSSVMDMPGDGTQLLLGIGAYDLAALWAMYGGAAAVYEDPSEEALALLAMPNGVLASMTEPALALDRGIGLTQRCASVDTLPYRPTDLAEGERFHALLDAGLVEIDGRPSRCRSPRVDYVAWSELGAASHEGAAIEAAVDDAGRPRVPFLRGDEAHVDAGNPLIQRGDRGADAWEIVDFLVALEETGQVLASHREDGGHPIPTLASRMLARAERVRSTAWGVARLARAVRAYAAEQGIAPADAWASIAPAVRTQALAAGAAFDQLARYIARPAPGGHAWGLEGWLVPGTSDTVAIVGEGASVHEDALGFGGRAPTGVEPYERVFGALLAIEPMSDGVSFAELAGDGVRRLLGENLAGDAWTAGSRVAANARGTPLTSGDGYPSFPLGWTRWWAQAPPLCWPDAAGAACSVYQLPGGLPLDTALPARVVALDTGLDAELRRFLATWALLYRPETWEVMMTLSAGRPQLFDAPRIELHAPDGRIFSATVHGSETIHGIEVERGIAARLIERGNALLAAAYATTPGPDLDQDGDADWWVPERDPSGEAVLLDPPEVCAPLPDVPCPCAGSERCVAFARHLSLVQFLHEAQGIVAAPR